ncbi:MAG: alpha/beta fold hydrolase [Chloroflexota bacterium]
MRTYPTGRPAATPASLPQRRRSPRTASRSPSRSSDPPYFSTRQAIEDLEAVREYLKVPKMHLYGESYGTQFVQTYATAHPDRIATLYLDGPVDLSVDGASYLGEAARTFNDTFIATINTCVTDRACRADLAGVDPLATYDALLAKARSGGISVDFPKADGTTETRPLTAGQIEMAAVDYLYSPGDRELLLRALVAAGHGNLVPYARLVYASLLMDPETLKVEGDPTYSDAMYYAVECQDYAYNAGAGAEADRTAAFLAVGRANDAQDSRFGAVYYDDMPCVYWPNTPTSDPRPSPIVNAPYPTVVLVATTDPITPVANAIRIANRLTKSTVVIQNGGPHVIFGWGLPCPDNPVADFMVSGKAFSGPIVVCQGSVADAYVPLAKTVASDYTTTKAFLDSFADQLLNTNDYVDMLDADPIALGCDFGGTLTYTPGDTGTKLAMTGCEFTQGLPVTATGAVDEDGGISLKATLPGGDVTYARDADGKVSLTGACVPERCLVGSGG